MAGLAYEAVQRLRGAAAQVCRRDLHGSVVVVSDGQMIQHTCGADYVYVDAYVTSLPLAVSQHGPGAPPTPPPRPGDNLVCENTGNAQICGSVSNTPSQCSTVTVQAGYPKRSSLRVGKNSYRR